jgi:hypothetical protein
MDFPHTLSGGERLFVTRESPRLTNRQEANYWKSGIRARNYKTLANEVKQSAALLPATKPSQSRLVWRQVFENIGKLQLKCQSTIDTSGILPSHPCIGFL